jgi:hypothetical protein
VSSTGGNELTLAAVAGSFASATNRSTAFEGTGPVKNA